MNLTDHELRTLLGLDGEDLLGAPQRISAPDGGTGHGYAAVTLDEDLEEATTTSPDWTRLSVNVPGAAVRRWDHDPRVLRVDGASVRGVRGATIPSSGGFLLDGRREPAVASVIGWDEEGRGWERAFVAANDLVVREVRRAASPGWLEALRLPDPPPDVPDPDDIFGALALDEWLADAVARLHHLGGTHRRVAALGAVARLWAPADTEGRRAWAAAARAGTTPLGRLRTWARSADPAVFEATALGVAAEVEALLDELEELRRRWLAGSVRPADVLAFLHSRDDLEGASLACRLASCAEPSESLALLDGAALEATDLLTSTGPMPDERLSAAASAAPESWWTAFVR